MTEQTEATHIAAKVTEALTHQARTNPAEHAGTQPPCKRLAPWRVHPHLPGPPAAEQPLSA